MTEETTELSDKIIGECFDIADELWEKIMEKYHFNEDSELDAGCIMFRMLVHGINTCKGFGWTKEDLHEEIEEQFKPENMITE